MIKIKTGIKEALSDPLEDHFCELVRSNWGIEKIDDKSPTVLFGFFETPDDAAAEYGELRKAFPALPESYDTEAVNDADWQNEYKKYLKRSTSTPEWPSERATTRQQGSAQWH